MVKHFLTLRLADHYLGSLLLTAGLQFAISCMS